MDRSLRILYLDRNPDNAQLVQAQLETDGIAAEMIHADNRAKFSAALKSGPVDVILALPDIDGFSALNIAHQICPQVPFIFVTGAFQHESPVDLPFTCAPAHVLKPGLSSLAATLRALRKNSRQQECRQIESKFQAIRNISLTVNSTFDLADILPSILAETDVMFPSAASYILLIDKATGKIYPGACRNLNEYEWRASLAGADFSLESLGDPEICDRGPTPLSEFHHSQGFVYCFGLPLIARNEPVGALFLLSRVEHKLSSDEVDYVETMAATAAMAISDARLYWSNQQLMQDLSADEEHIQRLITDLTNAKEEQARHIARELHDESAQLLASVHIALDRTDKRVGPELKAEIAEAKKLLDMIDARLRALAHELYPTILDNLGIEASLNFLAAQIADRKGIAITIEYQLHESLTEPKQLTLYRVVQEALNNVTRHAQASQAHIRLIENDTSICCSIRDNGVGFNPEPFAQRSARSRSHLGLRGMHERVAAVGGTLEILSTPGHGTKILIKMPNG